MEQPANLTTRRRILLGTATAMAALAGCGDSGGDGGDGSGGNSTATATPAGGTDGATTTGTTPSGVSDTATATPAGPGSGPDPNCARLAGSPTTFDAAGTPFVFTFDYVDTWTVQDPLEGPGGRSQGMTSPQVTVDGEPESAGIRVGQRFDPLTAAEVDEQIADAISGDYSPFEVVHEQTYAGETVRIVGVPDAELAVYRLWLPHDGQYYPVEIDVLTSILRTGDGGQELLCLDEITTATEAVRTTLRPNPDTTIASV